MAVRAERADPRRHRPDARRRRLRPDAPPIPQGLEPPRVVVEVAGRGKLVVGEPYFAPGVPVVLDRKSLRGAERGELAVVSSGRGRAKVEQRARPGRPRSRAVLEGLLVEKGARTGLRAVRAAGAGSIEGRVDLRELATFTIDPDTAKDFDDAISVAPRGGRDRAPGCTSPTSPSSSRPARRSTTAPPARAFSTYVPGLVAPMLAARARRRRLLAAAARRAAVRDRRAPAERRADLLPLGDPQRRPADVRAGAAARRAARGRRRARARRRATRPSCAGAGSPAVRSGSRAPRSRSSSTAAAASPAPGARASRRRTRSSRS